MSKFSDTDSDVESPSPAHLRAMARTGLTHSTTSLQSPLASPKILHNHELMPKPKLMIKLAQICDQDQEPLPEPQPERTEVKFFKAIL